MHLLLESGANFMMTDSDNRNLLHYAVLFGGSLESLGRSFFKVVLLDISFILNDLDIEICMAITFIFLFFFIIILSGSVTAPPSTKLVCLYSTVSQYYHRLFEK